MQAYSLTASAYSAETRNVSECLYSLYTWLNFGARHVFGRGEA